MAAVPTSPSNTLSKPNPPPRPLRRRRRGQSPVIARLVVDDLRGEVGFVSEDIWRGVFGFIKQEPRPEQEIANGLFVAGPAMVTVDDDSDEEPPPPTVHVAVMPLSHARGIASEKWTILPVTFLPGSSQFPGLPPATILLPKAIVLPPSLGAASEKGTKPFGVLLTDAVPVGLETVFVNIQLPVGAPAEDDQDLEDRVKEALGLTKIVRMGDDLPLKYAHGRVEKGKARIELCEPIEQGLLFPDTRVVIVKEKLSNTRRGAVDVDGVILDGDQEDGGSMLSGEEGTEENEDDEDDPLAFSGFLSAPSTSGSLSFPSMSSTPHLRDGYNSPSMLASQAPSGPSKVFTTRPLLQAIPTGALHPRPGQQDDSEARVFVRVGDLAKLGCFSGDWVRVSLPPPPLDGSSPTLAKAAETVVRGRGYGQSANRAMGESRSVSRSTRDTVMLRSEEKLEPETSRPVKVYSLPEGWETFGSSSGKRRRPGEKGKEPATNGESKKDGKPLVFLSPILLANLSPATPTITVSEVIISPFPAPPTSLLSPMPLFPPAAKEVTLLRIASPVSTDRALQPSLLLQLKSHFESCRRLVRKGDIIAVGINDVLARCAYGEGEDQSAEDLLACNLEEVRSRPQTCAAWFKVGSIGPAEEVPERTLVSRRAQEKKDNEEDGLWGGVVFVDPASTRMVQAGSERRKIPPTISSTWEYYLGLRPPPIRLAPVQHLPPALLVPRRFVNQTQRRLRELVSAATSQRAIQLGLQPIAILLTSTQRAIGKRTLALKASADVGVHVFHIDAYDIISDNGAGDVKTEGFLRARVERALSCGKESCVLLLSHIEALTAARMGEVLKDIVNQMRIVIATTTEVDKLSEGLRNVFTHEIEVGAPDEKERTELLEEIVDGRKVRIGKEVDLSNIAVKTAALVAGDLVEVVERATGVSKDRIAMIEKKCRSRQQDTAEGTMRRVDLEYAGGDQATSVLKCDFEVAVEAARRNFSDSIGAPKIPNVGWDDVGGLSNVKSAVMETIQLPLERPELFAKGMKKRSGILFYGPPGTGKTLLAKAIATEFSLNFFSIKGPELLNMYIGESEANVRRVFQRARDARPCVVFFDELDSVAPKRGNQGDSGGVMDRIVSQLLAELDGMSEGAGGSGGVFVIGATNRPDLLDAALLRPGRFDKMLYLGVSDTHEKQLTILEALTRKFTLHPSLSLRQISETLPFTYTGADLYALCSDAMLKAITRQASRVDNKIHLLSQERGESVSTAYFFDKIATPEDVAVVVGEEDFIEAKRELVGSVSAKELEHYQRVREQFEMAEEDQKKEKGKGKGKFKAPPSPSSPPPPPPVDSGGKGKGKGRVVELVRVQDPELQLQARLNPNEWVDGAEGDEEELYGPGEG